MRTLIRQATVIAMDDAHGADPFEADVLIEDERVAAVGPSLDAGQVDELIDGRERLVIPGLVNAHVHSWEAFFRGRYDNLPLELWMLLAYPIIGLEPLPPDVIRLRTLLVGIESLKNGVTCLQDDVIESPRQSMAALEAVFAAYGELGIRASCSGNMVDRVFTDTIPYANELLPGALLDRVRAVPRTSADEYLAFAREALDRFDDPSGRLRYVIAPSGPQRCTDELLGASAELARAHDVSLHIHVLETKTQAVTGQVFYERTLVEHLDELGVLCQQATLAHGVWLTPSDIDRLARSGTSIAHNAISNQKLGAGIAPLRALLDAGVNVALGSDGLCSNDSARMFDVMKAAALLHKVSTPDFTTWPNAAEILWAATRAGARSVRMEGKIGAISSGLRADLVLLDLRSVNFTPRNDLRNHLVYCENGTSIERVFVDGRTVVRDGRCTEVDEEAILAEIRGLAPTLLRRHERIEEINRAFAPHFTAIHQRCCAQPLGFNRYSGDEHGWLDASFAQAR
ncbi:MAG: amidohydrolase family protein [Solirubrobacteraceae bacterium]